MTNDHDHWENEGGSPVLEAALHEPSHADLTHPAAIGIDELATAPVVGPVHPAGFDPLEGFDHTSRTNAHELAFPLGQLRLAGSVHRPDGGHEILLAWRPDGWADKA
jgi:hypothetical protein